MTAIHPVAPERPADPAVEAEVDQLKAMPIAQLRARYRELYRADPPKAFGPDLLRRTIAHRVQEKAYGALSRSAQRLLDQMMKAYAAKPNGRLVLPRRMKPGAVLVREWKGRVHRVMVLADGFAYDGKTFGNLSEIAVLITGTRWNGPRFFGLRATSPASNEPKGLARPGKADDKAAPAPRPRHLGGGSDYRKLRTTTPSKPAPNSGAGDDR
jgi:hypothetical protein